MRVALAYRNGKFKKKRKLKTKIKDKKIEVVTSVLIKNKD